MGDRLATIDMAQKVGGCCAPFCGGAWSPSNRPISASSGILIHPAVWQHTNVTDRQTDRQTDTQTGQRSRSTERTVTCNVRPKTSKCSDWENTLHRPHHIFLTRAALSHEWWKDAEASEMRCLQCYNTQRTHKSSSQQWVMEGCGGERVRWDACSATTVPAGWHPPCKHRAI